MTLKSDTSESKASEPLTYRTITARWFGVLGPLAAVWIQQQLAYYFVLPACRRGFWPLLHLPPIIALAITAVAVMIGWRELDESGDGTEATTRREPGLPGSSGQSRSCSVASLPRSFSRNGFRRCSYQRANTDKKSSPSRCRLAESLSVSIASVNPATGEN